MIARKLFTSFIVVFSVFALTVSSAHSADNKIGYVDLRKAFYEYEEQKKMEGELSTLTEESQKDRIKKVEEITKLRDELELSDGKAKEKKQIEMGAKISALQESDKTIRQNLTAKKNDMLREVLDKIQKTVEEIGKKGKYDFVFDDRSVLYKKEGYDITDQVIKALNKKK